MIEVEIKLAITPVELFIRRIEGLGAVRVRARALEDNILLDTEDGALRAKWSVLRVREYGSEGFLAFKEPSSGPTGFKARRELEMPIPDAKLCLEILESVGFRRIWRYMKYRTVYRFEDIEICIDETPIGAFAELEGAPATIDAFSARLGRSRSDYLTSSYRGLYEEWCRERGTPVGDMVFAQGASA